LEVAVLAGRRAGEAASRAALEGLAVFEERRPEHLSDDQAALRRGLRAKWRQLGSDRELLVGECAYEQWHRLLFARFLAENELLLHPQYRAPVTLEDCHDLAAELGEPDGWSVAARFAAEILPGIFRLDDPCVRLRLAPEGRDALEQVLGGLPVEVFAADDALGWVYQFWQKDKKDEVNASERKIGGADLGPVTQLFTENYMVRFLLENSLGAWWASRHSDSPLVSTFEYLRFGEDGKPAAGSFDGWPERVAEVRVMDPCCGSGHFLVEAFSMLWQMRAEEEGLSAVEAQDAVLGDNLFGLELDPRCVQIAMFAVALQAWKSGGVWRQLPVPNIACSGIPVKAPVEEWKKLAGGDQRLENALERLHVLFRDADTLGSLIDPNRAAEGSSPQTPQRSLDEVRYEEIAPLFERVSRELDDPATAVLGADAFGIARAANLLSRQYTVVATNVPYLTRNKMAKVLRSFVGASHGDADGDLATVVLDRSWRFLHPGGTQATVSPQNWTYLTRYRAFRYGLLRSRELDFAARLGTNAFDSVSGEVVNILLLVASLAGPRQTAYSVDASEGRDAMNKAALLRSQPLVSISQRSQLDSPDSRLTFEDVDGQLPLLRAFAAGIHGLGTKDSSRFVRMFWEPRPGNADWERLQDTVRETCAWGGCSQVVFWEHGRGTLVELGRRGAAVLAGSSAYGRPGVLVSQIGGLPCTLYHGGHFFKNAAVVAPKDPKLAAAVWAFCSSGEHARSVRLIDQSLKVTNSTLVKVPFDVERWRRVAEEAGPLPEPWSDDPTQWLFDGRPEVSTAPLQVAVGRLLGYRWPEQASADDLDELADADGIVCLPSVAGEPLAADRLERVLSTAFGASWSPTKLKQLLERAGSRKKNLAEWLRDDFFKQHCALFGNRPFIWHVWDGQREGFAALVNYHRLDRRTLEKLTYTYLGQDWVERQRAAVRDEVAGAEARLAAALELQRKLELILAGEAPYDVYVRWKELHEQPVGWEPDLNDGVRLNIRPFVEAGVLRAPFNIHWKKDRGKNPDGSERHNDIHLPLVQKLAARGEAGRP
jgi:MmeI, DNA-methyltransferase domain